MVSVSTCMVNIKRYRHGYIISAGLCVFAPSNNGSKVFAFIKDMHVKTFVFNPRQTGNIKCVFRNLLKIKASTSFIFFDDFSKSGMENRNVIIIIYNQFGAFFIFFIKMGKIGMNFIINNRLIIITPSEFEFFAAV